MSHLNKERPFSRKAYTLRQTVKLWVLVAFLLTVCTACSGKRETLARIRKAGVLRIAIDPSFAPFEYINDDQELVGYDVDLALKITEALGVEAQFISTGYDALYDALTVDRADIIISALYPDPSRSQAFVYSAPYFNAGDVLVIADESISGWTSLGGKRVACLFGTAGHMTALDWQNSISPPPAVITANSPLTLTDALKTGELDAVLLDHVTALNVAGNVAGIQILPEMITDEPYAVASRIEDKALIEAVDDVISQLADDGTLECLSEKWMIKNH
jgi:polar amino acid transport system substrate-binding protein